jgi:hypothetical protein
MHLFDSKNGILSPISGLVFKLTPLLPVFYLGPIPVSYEIKDIKSGFQA